MNKKRAFIFPGQGAQYPKMGYDFYQKYPVAKALFDLADTLLGEPFSQLIFHGSNEELMQTKNSQLAIFITSIAILRTVEMHFGRPFACAGLSLGEYTALVAAEKITFEEALPLVKARGQFMQDACGSHPGTMQVVLGMELAAVKEAIAGLQGVWVANLNCPGQIVISGTKKGIEEATLLLKERGAKRVLPLDVSGAFHSGLMQEAQDHLRPLLETVTLSPSNIHLAMNVPGGFTEEVGQMRSNLINQVTQPVLWQRDIEALVAAGVEEFVEMGPGTTLAGMNKRIGVTVPTISIQKVEDFNFQGAEYATT